MNKSALFLCTAVAALALPAVAHGQWSDNFDTYNTTTPLYQQSTWEAWGNDPNAGQFFATDERSHSSPNSVICNGPDDAVHQYTGYTTGAWAYTAWQFIPNDPGTGTTYFILCNTYDGGGPLNNWSTQVAMDPTLGTVTSEFEGASVPLTTGSWIEIRVVIDLINDAQQFYYDGALVTDKSWTEGVSGGGALNIGCVDLWANNTAWSVYYDDLSLEAVPLEGACCLLDGTCIDGLSQSACETHPGIGTYRGHGTLCANVDCPVFGPCGWIITAPTFISGDTCGAGNDCALRPSQDETFEVVLPYASDWTFSVCTASWDTVLYVGTTCCGQEVGMNDDAPGCGAASELTVMGLDAGTYFVAVEGFAQSTCGPFTLVVSSPCEAPCDPNAIQEPEPICQDGVPDTWNVGCNGATPPEQVFTDIACGDIYCGTSGNFIGPTGANTRDMDWYQFDLTELNIVHWIGIGEFDVQMWIIDITNGCDNSSTIGSIGGDPCEEVDVPGALPAGTYTVVISTQDFTGWDCGVEYEARLTCDPQGPQCPEDINGDGVVNVLDLLAVLAAWGNTGGPEDVNGDGIVNVLDLLMVLAAWGPC